mgnify:CR=1 FL=1
MRHKLLKMYPDLDKYWIDEDDEEYEEKKEEE